MEKFIAEGTHLSIGKKIGEEFREEINTIMGIFKTDVISSFFQSMDFDGVFTELILNTGLLDAISNNAPGLLDEIRGTAEGSNADFKELVMLNCLDEVMSFSAQKRNADKCTCISIKRKDNDEVYVAQNLDLSNYLNKYQVIYHLKHAENDTEQLLFSTPGYLGYTGLNSKSVAVVPNALTMLSVNTKGVPVSIIVRTILEKQNAREAAGYIMSTGHGAAQNYTVGDSESIFSLECSGYKKEMLEVCGNRYFEYTAHTNHPLKNDDIWAGSQENASAGFSENSVQRQKTAERYLEKADHYFTGDDLIKLLTSHDSEPNCICRHGENGSMTIGSVVYKLTGDIEMHFAKGPGCVNKYEKFTFK